MIISRQIFRFPDPAEDLLLGLGIDPDPFLFLAGGYFRHHRDQTVDIFPFPSRVGTDVNGRHVAAKQLSFDDPVLFLHGADHFVLKRFRQERDRVERPFFQSRIIGVGIAHGDQMPDAPRHHVGFRFHIAVKALHRFMQR